MKILFWILAVLSIPAGLFVSIVSWFADGLGLYHGVIGKVAGIAGVAAVVVSIVCMVLGIIRLRKGSVKKAVAFAVAGVVYSALVLVGIFADEAVHSAQLEKSINEREEQMYGENWDAASTVEGIPERYQEELNKFYVAVRDEWTAEELMGLGAVTMPNHYGDAALENIGFALMDLNGDSIDELVIGTVASEGEATAIFCIYSDPENPFYSINAVEERTYYLHHNEAEGTYAAEAEGQNSVWTIRTAETENTFDFDVSEGTMDPAGRLTLDMIPFAEYK